MIKYSSANQLKQSIKNYLNIQGHFAWIQNNVRSIPGRSFVGVRGVPDVCCIMKGGKFLGVEVKAGKDKPSEHQIEFQKQAEARGAYYIFASSLDDVINIVKPTKILT